MAKKNKIELQQLTYIFDLEYPQDSPTIPTKLEQFIKDLEKQFVYQFPSTLINLKVEKVDMGTKSVKNQLAYE